LKTIFWLVVALTPAVICVAVRNTPQLVLTHWLFGQADLHHDWGRYVLRLSLFALGVAISIYARLSSAAGELGHVIFAIAFWAYLTSFVVGSIYFIVVLLIVKAFNFN
jgi:hypothetical protein